MRKRRPKNPNKQLDEIKKIYRDENLEICDINEYQNSHTKIKCINQDGYVVYTSATDIQQRFTPTVFGVLNPYTIYNIRLFTERFFPDYEFLSTEFTGARDKNLIWIKKDGSEPSFTMAWDSFQKQEVRRPRKTEEERQARRTTHEYYEWRRKVYINAKHKCAKCNKKVRDLEAHHKDGYNWCIERRYDESNGVGLCVDCHMDFHKKYGIGNNTEEQYLEWLYI